MNVLEAYMFSSDSKYLDYSFQLDEFFFKFNEWQEKLEWNWIWHVSTNREVAWWQDSKENSWLEFAAHIAGKKHSGLLIVQLCCTLIIGSVLWLFSHIGLWLCSEWRTTLNIYYSIQYIYCAQNPKTFLYILVIPRWHSTFAKMCSLLSLK